MVEPELGNAVDLLRLVWCPDDVIDGQLQPSAFPKQDLLGAAGRSLSVDRIDRLVPSAVRCTACRQRTNARRKMAEAEAEGRPPPERPVRDSALGSVFNSGAARGLSVELDKEVHYPLQVRPDVVASGGKECPLGNEGHCLVDNISGKKSPGFMLALRTKLVGIVEYTHPLEEILCRHGEKRLELDQQAGSS